MKSHVKQLLLVAAAFTASLLLGLVLIVVTQLVRTPFKSLALWLPIGVAAVTITAAIARRPWVPKYAAVDIGLRAMTAVALFMLFIFVFGVWGLSAIDFAVRLKQ